MSATARGGGGGSASRLCLALRSAPQQVGLSSRLFFCCCCCCSPFSPLLLPRSLGWPATSSSLPSGARGLAAPLSPLALWSLLPASQWLAAPPPRFRPATPLSPHLLPESPHSAAPLPPGACRAKEGEGGFGGGGGGVTSRRGLDVSGWRGVGTRLGLVASVAAKAAAAAIGGVVAASAAAARRQRRRGPPGLACPCSGVRGAGGGGVALALAVGRRARHFCRGSAVSGGGGGRRSCGSLLGINGSGERARARRPLCQGAAAAALQAPARLGLLGLGQRGSRHPGLRLAWA